jgi:hypothetical protein
MILAFNLYQGKRQERHKKRLFSLVQGLLLSTITGKAGKAFKRQERQGNNE